MKKTILSLSVLAMIATTSCKKDKDTEPKEVTPTVANLAGTYKVTAVTANNVNIFNNSNESLNEYEACDRDDQHKFNANLTYQLVDAGTVCTPNNNETSTWSLSGTTLTVDGEACTISSFNGKKLVVSKTVQSVTAVFTLEKQ